MLRVAPCTARPQVCDPVEDRVPDEPGIGQQATDDGAGATDPTPAMHEDRASGGRFFSDELEDLSVPVSVNGAEVRDRAAFISDVQAPYGGQIGEWVPIGIERVIGSGEVDEGADARVQQDVELDAVAIG